MYCIVLVRLANHYRKQWCILPSTLGWKYRAIQWLNKILQNCLYSIELQILHFQCEFIANKILALCIPYDLIQIFVGFLYTGWEVLYFCCWQGTICERITDHRSEPSLRSGRTQWVSLYSFIFVNVTAQSVNFICNKNLQVPATAVSLPQHNNYPQTLKQQELRITNRTDNFIQNLDVCLLYFIGYLTQN